MRNNTYTEWVETCQWIETCQQEIDEARAEMRRLRRVYALAETITDHEQRHVRGLSRGFFLLERWLGDVRATAAVHHLIHWSAAFESASSFVSKYVFDDVYFRFVGVERDDPLPRRAAVLLVFEEMRQRLLGIDPSDRKAVRAYHLYTQMETFGEMYQRFYRWGRMIPRDSLISSPQTSIEPSLLIMALRMTVYGKLRLDRRSDSLVYGDARVTFHSYNTLRCLWSIVIGLYGLGWQQQQVSLVVTVQPECLELAFAISDRRMTPDVWERIDTRTRNPFDGDYLVFEALREMGGSLWPHTWDVGYGQGVIVRLPWATS